VTIALVDIAAEKREDKMGRPREFNEEAALEAAIECFWQRGYEATSVRDLADKMGISAPSLYNSYGDKHALFVQALKRYLDHSMRARIKRLEDSLPPKQAIRRFIRQIIERLVSDRERRGCFLINSALEVAPHHRELEGLIADRIAEVEAFFYRSIKAAQAEGAVPRDRGARRPAWHSSSRPFKTRTGLTRRHGPARACASRLGATIQER
jgi:TetR/AcrR family transcriptional regulator, transcriptional repressor for nem operon